MGVWGGGRVAEVSVCGGMGWGEGCRGKCVCGGMGWGHSQSPVLGSI